MWIYVDICGYMWIYVDICGYMWVSAPPRTRAPPSRPNRPPQPLGCALPLTCGASSPPRPHHAHAHTPPPPPTPPQRRRGGGRHCLSPRGGAEIKSVAA